MRIKTLLSSLAVLAAAATATLALPAPVSTAAAAGLVTPACGWHPFSVSIANEGLQDSAAAYWLMPFTVQEGLQIRLDGRYPDARYASLQAYDAATALYTVNGVTSSLTDYQIQPDPGSANPWQHVPGRHRRDGNAFTVTLQSGVTPGEANTVPLPPIPAADTTSGVPGYLQYRVYLPAGGDFSGLLPPAVTFTLDGVSQQVPACPPGTPLTGSGAAAPASGTAAAPASGTAAAPPSATGTTTPAPEFVPLHVAEDFPNADSAYLIAAVSPPNNGDVLVIRGKAATTPGGSHPSPWPAPGTDLRYWSLCNYVITTPPAPALPLVANTLPGGKVDYGCRYDNQVATNHDGYYTFVVGTEAQREAIERIPGATFVPFSTEYSSTQHILFLRNMLVSPGFGQAIQSVQGGTAASAAKAMGPYYPVTALCPLSTLVRNGPGACFSSAS